MDDPANPPEVSVPPTTVDEPTAPARVKPIVEEIKPSDLTPEAAQANQNLDMPQPTPMQEPPVAPPAPMPPPPMEPTKKGAGLAPLVFAIVAFLIVALAGGVYVYLTGLDSLTGPGPSPSASPVPTPQPEESASPSGSPTASPSGEVDVSKLKVNILNGSGKIGEATKVKTLLEKEGFNITATGNASSFDFTNTVIQTKETVEDSVVATIEKALLSYSTEVGDPLKASNTYDIVITVGSK